MDNFKVIYKILKALEKSMDHDEFNEELISSKRLGVSDNRRDKLLIQLQKNGYIEGINIRKYVDEPDEEIIPPFEPAITIKGLEYLSENTMMKKVAKMAKGIADIVK